MKFIVKSGDICQQVYDCVVVAAFENGQLSEQAAKVDQLSGGYLNKLTAEGELTGKVGTTVLLRHLPNVLSHRILVVGC